MTLDSLDDLLDRSAQPPGLTRQTDLDAMISEARVEATHRRRRGPACGREADRVAEAERNFPHERRAGVVRWSGAC